MVLSSESPMMIPKTLPVCPSHQHAGIDGSRKPENDKRSTTPPKAGSSMRQTNNPPSLTSLAKVALAGGFPITPRTTYLTPQFVPLGGKSREPSPRIRTATSPTRLELKVIDVPASTAGSRDPSCGTPHRDQIKHNRPTNSPLQSKATLAGARPETQHHENHFAWKPAASCTMSADDAMRAALAAVRQEGIIRSKEIADLKSMIEAQHSWFEQELSRCVSEARPSQPFQNPSEPISTSVDPVALTRNDFDTLLRSWERKVEDMRSSFVEKACAIVREQDRIATEFNNYVQKISEEIHIVATELRTESELRDMADAKLNSRLGSEIASSHSRVDEVTKILQEAIAKDCEDMSALYALVHEALGSAAATKGETYLLSQQLEKDRARMLLLERQTQFCKAAIQSAQHGAEPRFELWQESHDI